MEKDNKSVDIQNIKLYYSAELDLAEKCDGET